MSKQWDGTGIETDVRLWAECLRVLRPGGYLLAFGGTRTFHRLAVAVEDAGFEIRDSIAWLYGSGFPKSLDVGKAIDKAAGAERAVVGRHVQSRRERKPGTSLKGSEDASLAWQHDLTAPATDAARQWSGWGTALKPAFEPIVIARKPLTGTVAANVQAWGTGALNIDACRVGTTKEVPGSAAPPTNGGPVYGKWAGALADRGGMDPNVGRWPANVVLDGDQADALDQQSGHLHGSGNKSDTGEGADDPYAASGYHVSYQGRAARDYGAMGGGASRFFPTFRYQAKAPTAERPTYVTADGRKIAHPTVKPLGLMRWLVRLVTPPGGTVLDPFAGSGATVEACLLEGFDCIAIERDADYLPLIAQRIDRQAGTLPLDRPA